MCALPKTDNVVLKNIIILEYQRNNPTVIICSTITRLQVPKRKTATRTVIEKSFVLLGVIDIIL
jgi:hypothetical protein